MKSLMREGLEAGALGYATSKSPTHVGYEGRPVPSRLAAFSEIREIASALGEAGDGVIQATVGKELSFDEFAELNRVSGRHVSWTALLGGGGVLNVGSAAEQLARSNELQSAGSAVFPQVTCRPLNFEFRFDQPFLFQSMPVFAPVNKSDHAEKLKLYADNSFRAGFRDAMRGPILSAWDKAVIAYCPDRPEFGERLVCDVAAELGCNSIDLALDLSIQSDLQTRFRLPVANADEDEVATLLRDSCTARGLSDAGAHASQLCDACFSTHLLGRWVREKHVLTLEEAVRTGLTAEAAVDRVRNEHRARFAQARDPYIRERLHDFEDLANRLLRVLAGDRPGERELPDDAILVARNLGPADLLEYPRHKLRGLLLEEGSAASHAAIVARALQIPCVGRLMGLRDRLSEGDLVIVDGETGEAYLRPRPDMLAAVQSRIEVRSERQAEFTRLRDVDAATRDGVRITLLTNAGLAVDLENLDATGAEGIGLFRTEFPFMVSEELPRLDSQTALYKLVLDTAGDRPVTFRTLDIGGDKVLPYLQTEREENPALGRRAIRLGLDRPGLLRLQLRALLAAASGRELRVMFPMIATVDEFRAARELVDVECAWARRRGRSLPALLRVGAMIECPSLLWHLDALLPLTDFVSVGTNDLFQYMFAADRTNPLVSDRYDPLSPPALRALAEIQRKCADTGTPVSVCGELAGRPLEAFALLTLGFTRLSAPAGGVGPVKRMILSTDLAAARRGMANLLGSSAGSVRGELESLARKLNVTI